MVEVLPNVTLGKFLKYNHAKQNDYVIAQVYSVIFCVAMSWIMMLIENRCPFLGNQTDIADLQIHIKNSVCSLMARLQ
jgi:hypothetical protein